ncbi:YycH family regulatory protein [Alkalihalobacillus trypoxylicola]|uniref:Regulatory protein YycH domain-containing protein n=1 Tax=Alkalihalobacillus trypoxylicola TaxID=519424 RepID=A0A161PBJ0_9BACI|nr:two-component system activity regulator YycH [Alkalihalobacillus trypoxylicola]KYG29622.1 hypothetical protein AZF04_08900 [Alkalihalobacillus trypoxylicola]
MSHEQTKNWLLTGLVALSLLLTWEMWTFQPDIEWLNSNNISPTEPLTNEEKELREVIKPESLVVHNDNENYLIPIESDEYQQIYPRIFQELIEGEVSTNSNFFPMRDQDGLEIIFPTNIPIDVFTDLFRQEEEELFIPLESVDRMFLFTEEGQLFIQLYSTNGPMTYVLRSSLDGNMFQSIVLDSMDGFEPAKPIKDLLETDNYAEQIYIPTERVKARTYSYTTRSISIDFFQRLLFPNPSVVNPTIQEGGTFYTDGSRILEVTRQEDMMDFHYPVLSDSSEPSSRQIVESSFDYINGHGGFTDDYHLWSWTSLDGREEAVFRMMVNHLPVLRYMDEDLMKLTVTRTGGQTVGYSRPLFAIESQPSNIIHSSEVKLLSGEELLEVMHQQFMDQQMTFDLSKVSKVMVGYDMRKRDTSYVTLVPAWFIQYDGRWFKPDLKEAEAAINEEEGNELE